MPREPHGYSSGDVPVPIKYPDDFVFAESCLASDLGAISELRLRYFPRVERFLVGAGAAPAEAAEIAAELLTDLLAAGSGRTPLLQKYTGQCAILSWLNRVALNRLIDRHRKESRSIEQPMAEVPEAPWRGDGASFAPGGQDASIAIIAAALQRAFAECAPADYVLIRLFHGEGLRGTEVARMFGVSHPTVPARADCICAELRFQIMASLREKDPWLELTWDDLLELCRTALPDLFGEG
jgi:DNA-directed RNA polymerase specialized sigma24 family protein